MGNSGQFKKGVPNKSVGNLVGQRFGRLTVIERAESYKYYARWKCVCDCGNECIIRGASLRNGNAKSCGCLCTERTIKANTTHGKTKTRLYRLWSGMNTRCYNSNEKNYHSYGGRGIIVCTEWKSFEPFYDWAMENGYEAGLSIERVDVNGNYEPSNCTWIPRFNQAQNKTTSIILTLNGESHCLRDWSRRTGICYGTLMDRVRGGWSDEDALTIKPVLGQKLYRDKEKV